MESPTLLLSSSSWSTLRSCSWATHSPVALHFAGRSQFSRLPLGRFRTRATSSGGDAEEQRWLREEQRWLREEQRWLREEERWHGERRLMSDELAFLKREVEQLRNQVQERRSLPSVVDGLRKLVQSFPMEEENAQSEIQFVEEEEEEEFEFASSVTSPQTMASFSSDDSSDDSTFSSSPSIPSMAEFSIDLMAESLPTVPPIQPRRELRKGAEGEEVQVLQEALEALGFYPGEEDMEYFIFADGTEAAVKTWQATLGVREDGVASPALQAILFGDEKSANPNTSPNAGPKANGRTSTPSSPDPWKSPPTRLSGSDSLHNRTFAENKRDVEDTPEADIDANRRVFLLGENRWEEPARLRPVRASKGSQSASNGARSVSSLSKCFSCQGDGKCMCTECEGTGELNVEDQFLDWVDEGAKCPYCEGSGAIPCDVCLGRGAIAAPV